MPPLAKRPPPWPDTARAAIAAVEDGGAAVAADRRIRAEHDVGEAQVPPLAKRPPPWPATARAGIAGVAGEGGIGAGAADGAVVAQRRPRQPGRSTADEHAATLRRLAWPAVAAPP